MMLTKFVRREPTVDDVLRAYDPQARRFDVVAYADRAATEPQARWLWFQKSRPRPGQRTAMLNCFRWRLVWLPPAPFPPR